VSLTGIAGTMPWIVQVSIRNILSVRFGCYSWEKTNNGCVNTKDDTSEFEWNRKMRNIDPIPKAPTPEETMWTCDHCETLNPNNIHRCHECDASRKANSSSQKNVGKPPPPPAPPKVRTVR